MTLTPSSGVVCNSLNYVVYVMSCLFYVKDDKSIFFFTFEEHLSEAYLDICLD